MHIAHCTLHIAHCTLRYTLQDIAPVHRETSFKRVKDKRDYLGGRKSAGNWLYLSRLAAAREHAFMSALHGQARAAEWTGVQGKGM